MGFREYARAIRKGWWIVLLAVVVSGAVGVVVTLTTQKLYATTLTFFVKTPSDQLSVAAQGDTFGQKRVNSYVQLASTDRLIDPILADTKVNLSADELSREITASGDLNTVLLTVTVKDSEARRSLAIGNAVAKEFVTLVGSLESTTAGDNSTVRLELVSGPNLDNSPVTPKPLLNIALAVIVGTILGLLIAILREILDTTVRSTQILERTTGTAVIGVIAYDASAKEHPLIVEGHAKSVRAEAFRQLRTNLQFVDVDSDAKLIVVTSSVSAEGKSSTATNLAVIFAEAGRTVLLIEGDLRRPRVADYLGLEGSVGLTNVLAGQAEIGDVLQQWGKGGLTVLPSGSIPPNPSELLGSKHMGQLLEAMAAKFDVILIDSPPLLPVTDAAILATRADGAILVVRHGSTSRQQVAFATAALAKVDARLLGCVLNMAPLRGDDSGYGYGYGYQDTEYGSVRPKLSPSDRGLIHDGADDDDTVNDERNGARHHALNR